MSERLREHYRDLEAALIAQGRAAGILTSPTGLGRAREAIVNDFLRPHLPQRLSVVRGELIDASGRSSGELDTILRDNQSLAWGLGGEQLLPVEAAAGVLEIKSDLAGRNLVDALEKAATVKTLERLPHHGVYVPTDDAHVEIPPVRSRVYVLAYGGPSWGTIVKNLLDSPEPYRGDYMRWGPEAIVILGRGALYKIDNEILAIPTGAENDFAHCVEDRPGLELIAMHITETIRRYGGLHYEMTQYMGATAET